MSKKIGRPPKDNPKNEKLTVRLESSEMMKLDDFCRQKRLSRADGIRLILSSLNDKTMKSDLTNWCTNIMMRNGNKLCTREGGEGNGAHEGVKQDKKKAMEYEVKTRLDEKTMEEMEACRRIMNANRSQVVRAGIHRLFETFDKK